MDGNLLERFLRCQSVAELKRLLTEHQAEVSIISLYNRRKQSAILTKVDEAAHLGKTFAERLFNVVNEAVEVPRCDVCGKPRRWSGNFKLGYYLTCGQRCFTRHPAYQENRKRAMREKFGVDNPAQAKAVQEKIRQTTLERHGVTNGFQTERARAALRESSLRNYGDECHLKSPAFHAKSKATYFKRLWDAKRTFIEQHAVPLFDAAEFDSVYREYRWRCARCQREFLDNLVCGFPRCPSCLKNNGRSRAEKQLFDFIEGLVGAENVQHSRYVLDVFGRRGQVDVFIPSLSLGIEFNGLFWHSINGGTEKSYHLDKTNAALRQGIKLVHVFEDDWLYKREIVKSRLRNLLGRCERRLYARRCEVKQIEPAESARFLNANHLFGSGQASVHLGLFLGSELVSVMTFSRPRFNKSYAWELIRFASALNTVVIGGASKLFTFFRDNFLQPGDRVISYSDRCWGEGEIYRKLGFMFVKHTPPAIWYADKRVGRRENRLKFQKHKLRELLPTFNEKLTELENMMQGGYYAVPDCGSSVFEFVKG